MARPFIISSMGSNECPLCWIEAHAGNPDGAPTAEELKRRIHYNFIRVLLMGEDCPLKYLSKLREDLELWEKYEATGLVPPALEELVV